MKLPTILFFSLVPTFLMALTPNDLTPNPNLISILLSNLNTLLGGLSTAFILWLVRKLEKKRMNAKHQLEKIGISEALAYAEAELKKRNKLS